MCNLPLQVKSEPHAVARPPALIITPEHRRNDIARNALALAYALAQSRRFVATVGGAPLAIVKQYIASQKCS